MVLMDTAKQYFARLRADELTNRKSVSSVYRQTQPLQLTHLDEGCGAQKLQADRRIPSTWSQRIFELHQCRQNLVMMSGYLSPQNLKY
jgi:hypothetical protein